MKNIFGPYRHSDEPHKKTQKLTIIATLPPFIVKMLIFPVNEVVYGIRNIGYLGFYNIEYCCWGGK